MAKKKESFESLMEQLEDIVFQMENNNLTLEENMKNYETGISITNKLYKILSEAEGKIKVLTEEGEKEFIQ